MAMVYLVKEYISLNTIDTLNRLLFLIKIVTLWYARLNIMWYYIIAINLLGLLLVYWNRENCKKHAALRLYIPITLVCLIGGAIGCAAGFLFVEHKTNKENMMTRVLSYCLALIEILLLFFLPHLDRSNLSFRLWEPILSSPYLLYYLLGINAVAFAVYGIDKRKAVRSKYRVPIVTLLSLAALGGSVGAYCAMRLFHHKTRQPYFSVGVPLIFLVQLMLLFFAVNLI